MDEKRLREVVESSIDSALARIFQEKMDQYLQRIMEGHFYKDMTLELKKGLDEIYRKLSQLREAVGGEGIDPESANMVFQEASDQLDAILKATEQATEQIMDITEGFQQKLAEMEAVASSLPDGEVKQRLMALLSQSNSDCLDIITACSFQDITGQRVKKVITALHEIEERILEILVATGIKIKAKKEGRDELDIEEEAKKAVDLLKGPQEGVDQGSVDDLLAELGL